MSDNSFDLTDCPTPYPPWIEGASLPEIFLTIPLDEGEDLSGSIVQMILTRDTTDPDNPDVLEKTLVEISNVAGQQWSGKVSWSSGDLIEGDGQSALFILTNGLGEKELIGRFFIDVINDPDPNP